MSFLTDDVKKLGVRYGISFISEDQAKKNLEREIAAYDVDVVAKIARNDWNDALGKSRRKAEPTTTRPYSIPLYTVATNVRST